MNNATQIKQPTIQQVQWTQFWEKKSMDKQAENEKKEMISQTWEISVKQNMAKRRRESSSQSKENANRKQIINILPKREIIEKNKRRSELVQMKLLSNKSSFHRSITASFPLSIQSLKRMEQHARVKESI